MTELKCRSARRGLWGEIRGSVAAEEYREDGVYYRGTVKIDDLHRFEEFLV